MNVVLISTYELGHQPFGLASPAAWLREAGARVTCLDLAVQALDERAVREADLVAIHLQMHTATRLAIALMPRLQALNPGAHYCFFGLYAPLNEPKLRALGAATVLGGEYESGLLNLYRRLDGGGNGRSNDAEPQSHAHDEPVVSQAKQRFRVPDRRALPGLAEYAYLDPGDGGRVTVGYTEASRGCKHLCRHCPVVPVYNGAFRVVQRDVVLADVRQQVAAGAQHITFGDPDFFNGVGHATKIVSAFNEEFPDITYDVTIKIEHLLKHRDLLRALAETGCLFVTSAVESVDDDILNILDKGHTREDFRAAVALCRDAGLTLSPTFIPFTPWTTPEGYLDLLGTLIRLELVDHVAPIQLAIRLLVPESSKLLETDALERHLGPFDQAALSYAWQNPDPRVEALNETVRRIVQDGDTNGADRRAVFRAIWEAAQTACGRSLPDESERLERIPRRSVPRVSEPWYCCAEPTEDQLARL